MIDRNEIQWYRDAVIYQLHVKSFFDSNNNGCGDFRGLTQKLDYIKDLGATAIWLMPFYPSPLRDDGYDIADYRGINPAFGTLRDFRTFVREAHERGLRVITELVINHTSDQHPWFKRARAAKPGSVMRDFYVWSQDDHSYKDARIIFLDTEKSNWTWDEEAKAFYWHRFYNHQPDLNFDNPRVIGAVLEVMRYWLDMGVDGLRLDAIPYLIEREETNCENLAETHAVIKKVRAAVDAAYPDRMLIAEANQWPEDTAQYFGQGDECHMAFHFPLMPRIYMALAQEDRHPITDIMRQTPEIPDGTQWAIFLRNHDEMTLEMVTDRERDYLWSFYAADQRARLNLGIRRRLAPLLENDRRKIELLNSLLFSMPGTPVIYYGDEIGMGDNIYLGDRDGVRTPMQWSVDRNGGFSRADPAKLFLPAIQDPIYGYNAVNVEAQSASTSSLLNWMRRMIAVRRSHRAFGRGTLRFLYPANRKVLVYLREADEERILCIVNVSRAPQAVELDLAEFRGMVPVELTAGSVFPPIGTLPYLLTLPAYGFFWFKFEAVTADQERFGPKPAPELFTLVVTGKLESFLSGRELLAFERTIAPRFLMARRWFGSKNARIQSVRVKDFAILRDGGPTRFVLPILDVHLPAEQVDSYFTPLAAEEERDDESVLSYAVARVRRAARTGILYDADANSSFATALLAALRHVESMPTNSGAQIVFSPSPLLASQPPVAASDVHRLSTEQSHTSLNLANHMILKIYRRLQPGMNPEIEIGRFLTEVAEFPNIPPILGVIEYVEQNGTRTALAVLQRFIRCQGDAWTWTLEALKRILETLAFTPAQINDCDTREHFSAFVPHMQRLGLRTAELHKALTTPTDDPAFAAEPFTLGDMELAAEDATAMLARALARLRQLDPKASETTRINAANLLAREPECIALIEALTQKPVGAIKCRIHGDYHLGQVLVVKDDVVIIDFEGEPSRPLDQRRSKSSPLRDVAGMLRSFAYAVATAKRAVAERLPDPRAAAEELDAELVQFSNIFIEAYGKAAQGSSIWIEDEPTRMRLLRLFLLSKALYEIDYEAGNRPDWLDIPILGVLGILDEVAETV
jgi:maltose alpha-D-glucosyltransferase/alpha-amylase